MRTVIFYFSGTGNCLKVARDLASELGNTELIPVAKAIKDKAKVLVECIGIIYPVYMFGMPLIVKKFREGTIESASCVSCNKCFAAIVNHMPLACYNKLITQEEF